MLKGLNLQQLAAKIQANATMKRDFIIPTEAMTMQVVQEERGKKSVVMELPDGHGNFPLLPLAHDQIGARSKIPAKYYDRMLAEAPDLLAANVNAWHRINPAKRMVRTLGGDMRAFLSNSYNRIENEEIAQVVFPILAELKGVNIVSCEVTDKRLYIHFVVPTIQGEVKVGDVVQAGGIIANSEVGCGAVSVSGLIWRLWCLNGAKTGETFRRNHVGREIDDTEALWADDTREAEDRSILLKVRDMVKAVVDETRFKANLAKMQGLAGAKVTGDPTKAVEVLAAKLGAADFEKDGILRSLIEGADLTAWGLLNAVTAQSHTAKSYDRAVELEAAGGSLIDLNANEWKKILEAA
ncbi:MAG TPA: DUF932 domain-containing protein [Nitrososphaera sp.]|nr:DUF932 domain-containing protein [Nitrososphaera sp.]